MLGIRKHIAVSVNKESVNTSISKNVFYRFYLFLTPFISCFQKYLRPSFLRKIAIH